MAHHYPMPEFMLDKELVLKLHWSAIALSEEPHEYFSALMDQSDVPQGPIPPEFIMAAVLGLIGNLANLPSLITIYIKKTSFCICIIYLI